MEGVAFKMHNICSGRIDASNTGPLSMLHSFICLSDFDACLSPKMCLDYELVRSATVKSGNCHTMKDSKVTVHSMHQY